MDYENKDFKGKETHNTSSILVQQTVEKIRQKWKPHSLISIIISTEANMNLLNLCKLYVKSVNAEIFTISLTHLISKVQAI